MAYETSCVRDQTLGRDGAGMRTLVVNIGKPHNPEFMFGSYLDVQPQGQASEVTALDGVGDEAKSVLTAKRSDPRVMSGHVVREGANVVAVRYVGADPSLFSREANPDVPGLQAMCRAVLDEVLGKL